MHPDPDPAPAPVEGVTDRLGRGLADLRISVTDRCNFRCTYCMPRQVFGPDHAFLERSELLSFEEITRVVAAAAHHGVTKVRLTGGEPLLRRELHTLVAQIAAVDGVDDIAMTTNASLLADAAGPLRDAGLTRVTVSLDALDRATFAAMSDTKIPLQRVLDGIAAAQATGLPVKVNTVVRRGVNDDQVVGLAGWAREHGVTVRFIEYMDVGTTNGWRHAEVVASADVVAAVTAAWPASAVGGEATAVADRWRYDDGAGEFGVVSSVTEPFCSTCVRARLSAVGELFTCLFATRGHDLRAVLRGGADDAALRDALAGVWSARTDRYSEERTRDATRVGDRDRVEMSYIGG